MGNSLPCPCLEQKQQPQRRPTDGVLVMASDGSLLQFKSGTSAEAVVAGSHRAGHRVVRCDSNRTVLSGPDALEASRFYFLVPGEKAACRRTYEAFWAVGVSKLYLPDRSGGGKDGSAPAVAAWTPRLGPIPEASASASASASSPSISVENANSYSPAPPREVSVVPPAST